MSAAIYPVQIGTPWADAKVPVVANTNRDGSTGTYYDMSVVDSVNGGLVERLGIVHSGPQGTPPTGPNVIRMWRKQAGGTRLLIGEFLTPASPATPAVGVLGSSVLGSNAQSPWQQVNIRLQKGECLSWSIAQYVDTRDQWTIMAEGGGFTAQ